MSDEWRLDFLDEADDAVEEAESGKDRTVLLVDASPPALEPAGLADAELAGRSWLGAALRLAAGLLRARVIAGAADEAAVVLYNTREEGGGTDVAHVWVLQPLGPPDAERILELENLDDAAFASQIGSHAPEDAAEAVRGLERALWEAARQLAASQGGAPKAGAAPAPASVIVVTREHRGAAGTAPGHEEKMARERAESLAKQGATLSLMPLVGPGEPPFELSPFWAEMMRRGTPADPAAAAGAGAGDAGGGGDKEAPAPAPAPALQELLDERVWPLGAFSTTVRAKAFKKRALTRLSWVLGPAGGAAIGLRLHKLLAPAWPNQRAAGAVWFDALDNVALKPSTAAIAQDTGERVPPEAPRRFWPKPTPAGLAPRLPRVFLSREEERELRAPVPKGLRLLGFRPLAAVAPAHALEPPLFAYPDEAGAPGSARAFSAVLAAMLARRVAALCVLVRGPAAYPRLVHALPQAEVRGEYGEQLAPPGLWLLPAPFADELRAPERERNFAGPHPDAAAPTEAAVAAAEAAVRALALPDDFDSTALPNPHLQRHFQVVEALALGRPVPPAAADATLEAGAEARAAAAPAVQAFKDAVYGPGYTADMAPPAGGAKRKAAGGAPAPVSAEEAAAVAALRVPEHAADGTLAKLKADDLKRYCAAHGLPRSGNKGDLAARIEAHLERAAAAPPPAAKAAKAAASGASS